MAASTLLANGMSTRLRGFRRPRLMLIVLSALSCCACTSLAADAQSPPLVVLEPTFWNRYAWLLAAACALCVLQALVIAALLLRWRLARSERRFRQAVDAAPIGMLIVGQDGKIVAANKQVERLFGYSSEKLIGQGADMLVPADFGGLPADDREDSVSAAEASAAIGRDQVGRRQDGTEFPVEVGLSKLKTDSGPYVLASVIDISEQKRVESQLRESREELRQLTGKILGAQEGERRRIARELHDDFGQNLALLSVEMDLLRQGPRQTPPDYVPRLESMSIRVKQLSSSIHDLSHQLHPMKLDQLGLVAALRGLCKELTQCHGVHIEFLSRREPAPIPPDVALCLYRVAQEALRNVIKHSGAACAEVALVQRDGSICLYVEDAGVGFDTALVAGQGGLGFVSMRERLRHVGGEICIESQPSGGTRIEAIVPLGRGNSADGDSASMGGHFESLATNTDP